MPPAEIRTSLRMPQTLHEQLTRWAEINGHSFSDEVRQRLMASFGPQPPHAADLETRELLSAIEDMSSLLADHYPAWHEDAFSFQAFATAIIKFLRSYQPEGDPEPKPKTADRLFNEKATVDGVSALLVGSAINLLQTLRRHEAHR